MRVNKIITLRLQEEVIQLKTENKTLDEITEIINQRHPEVNVSRSCIARFVKGEAEKETSIILTGNPTRDVRILKRQIKDLTEEIFKSSNTPYRDKRFFDSKIRNILDELNELGESMEEMKDDYQDKLRWLPKTYYEDVLSQIYDKVSMEIRDKWVELNNQFVNKYKEEY